MVDNEKDTYGDKENGKFSDPQNSGNFGDFEEIKEEEKPVVATNKAVVKKKSYGHQTTEQGPVRVRLPRDRELIGVVVQRLGGNKMEIRATDGKTRNSRVPGRYKRKMWLRPGNFVIILPWESDDDKADIIYQYRDGQANQLRRKGLLESLKDEF